MKTYFIDEPELEFGQGTHVCPRAGITEYDVFDTRLSARREKILVGAVGTSDNLAKFKDWLDRCSDHIPAKADAKKPNLSPAFCGFNSNVGFKASIVFEEEITRKLSHKDIEKIKKIKNWKTRINIAVDLYYRQVKFLMQNRVVDLVVCIIPNDLYDEISKQEIKPLEETIEDEKPEDNVEANFRRALKAKTMHLGKPLQLIRELSLDSNPKKQQDDATKAWNFCTAVYYKANQTVPWRLITNNNRPAVCFVGIGFYRSRDRKVLHTSLAQIFDELGNGVILRGTPVNMDKNDPRPHLQTHQAYDLLHQALSEYEVAMGHSPARLVIHKSSIYNDAEMVGFREAAGEMRIGAVDFVTILDTDIRLLRDGGLYPPYRGTHIELDKRTHLLYTRGAVRYYRTYTGLYIPQPLEVRIVDSDESPGVAL